MGFWAKDNDFGRYNFLRLKKTSFHSKVNIKPPIHEADQQMTTPPGFKKVINNHKLLPNRLNIPVPCKAEQPTHPRMH
jgi:hypothetical protein